MKLKYVKNYLDLINKIKIQKNKTVIDEFIEMRLNISKRIEELENYFDENFGNYRMNILQKGIFQLKSYYFIILIITMSQKKQIYLNSDD